MSDTEFKPDPQLFEVIRECTENYEVGSPGIDWPNNILSTRTVVYGSGVIALEGEEVSHNVDPDELARCKALSHEAHKLVKGMEVGMGSESDDTYSPFFICNNCDAERPTSITDVLIRSRFGGTIFPTATITVEPLRTEGVWWGEVCRDIADLDEECAAEAENCRSRWRDLIAWFAQHTELADPVFIRIGDIEALWDLPRDQYPEGTEITGCVLPRMAVALMKQGSLVGIFGYSVQT